MSTNPTHDAFLKRGVELFMEHCNPVIREVANQLNSVHLAALYSGIFDALYGSMCADFGHESALEGLGVFAKAAQRFSATEGQLPC